MSPKKNKSTAQNGILAVISKGITAAITNGIVAVVTALICLFSLAQTVTSCGQLPVYCHFEQFDSNGWKRSNPVTFCINANETTACSIDMDLRASSLYPYTELVLIVQTGDTDHHINRTDTINIDITDEKGNPIGPGLSIRQYHFKLMTAQLTPNDTLNITVAHNMSREYLPGVVDIGITANK